LAAAKESLSSIRATVLCHGIALQAAKAELREKVGIAADFGWRSD
jgi:hypothetical protein